MNYYEYFSEIEERFSRRRGTILLLSTLDWALIETWREAGIPLQAVLRGIDEAFDKHDAKAARGRTRKVNGLAWCAQAVMQAAEASVEASTGAAPAARIVAESGFEPQRVAAYLDRNAATLDEAASPAQQPSGLKGNDSALKGNDSALMANDSALKGNDSALKGTGFSPSVQPVRVQGALAPEGQDILTTTALRLRELAAAMRKDPPLPLDELDRTLTVLEERLFTALQTAASEDTLVQLRTQADRELAPYRARMSAVQLRQIQQQFLHKRLLELHALPRLSLFYMGHDD